jgi:predicted phosphate transport protein (TIGR00153 family)
VALFGKKDDKLFQLFEDSSRVVVKGGDILKEVVSDYRDLDAKIAKLTAMEHEGDHIIQQLVERLNTSFVLPFDREDAFSLVQKLDAKLDFITGIIDRIVLYKAGEPNETVTKMVDILYDTLLEQEKAFSMLSRLDAKKKQILACCERIKQLERDQDTMYRTSMAHLFETEKNPIVIIKWKEVYEHIEMANDYCEDIADAISNLCIKYS